MRTAEDVRVLEAMRRYGGGFVSRLGEAALAADDDNLQRIKEAFPEYWREYVKVAELHRVRDARDARDAGSFYDARNKGGECGD